ncbi:MAG TPA: 3-phosphoshikimate 1-carboxyvinyltransferase [Kiritimatiellia bacterium]|nr:3-phosphoshikimate 1-carboxyvinyltransferase [Kiritimatiellia bacterium]HMP96556.1 3-phosphoshikimate 1-carboxyvinyltransferase [Kiritimatiellia bacterium]
MVTVPISAIVHPAEKICGEIRVPGDKSISHRVAMFSGMASGASEVENFLQSEDCVNTLKAMEALGARSFETPDGKLNIQGTGGKFIPPAGALDIGNSGTSIRLLSGILASCPFTVELTGDESLRSRPMRRIKEPLEMMGAKVELTGEKGTAPIRITGGKLKGIDYLLPVASAQVKSCIMLAGLFAEGITRVTEPVHTRDHTERLLGALGLPITLKGLQVEIRGLGPKGPTIKARPYIIPGDFSSAAFWMVAVAARPGQTLVVRNVGLNPRRIALLDVLKNAGAGVTVKPYKGTNHVEPAGDITIKGARLTGFEVGGDAIPNLIDELPVIFVLAALAKGRSVIKDAHELRVKESDRIATMAGNLRLMGVDAEEQPDGMIINGGNPLTPQSSVRSFGDHRIAMSMAILGTHATAPVIIQNVACVDTSYPGFWDHLRALGGHVE